MKKLIYPIHLRASKNVVKKITKIFNQSGHKEKYEERTLPFVPKASNTE